ncbi:SGNH/GDSL hydrolase family protein [Fangia hongkongensis]|uniref:SGNH/GDSL hydrolase family protein n=1 Tax=Fangia hongkongensis TaxID=270495 RepID=UPI000377BC39|nr:SGNH/GDSL hydrolase family protein [Fangia hongkongensis]MBK2124603.1 SGNH/GDSL hydrolase family protein [Fangia hongkongensis]
MLKKMLVLGLLAAPVIVSAKAGMNIYVENHCAYPVKFTQTKDHYSDPTQNVELAAYQSALFNYISTGYLTDTHIVRGMVATADGQELGKLLFSLDNGWTSNDYKLESKMGNIAVDNLSKSWHNWYGTPNITVSTCQDVLDIQNASLFDDVTRVLVFGDSLSDKGTLFEYTQGVVPDDKHYYNGMFSNGNVWTWHLKNALRSYGISLSNYAVGGATAVLNPDLEHLPYSLSSEVSTFNTNAALKNWQDYNHFLAFIWIGANDYLTEPQLMNEQSMIDLTNKVKASIKENITKLIKKGINKFVIMNLPDLSKTPESQYDNQNTATTARLTELHNQKLKALVDELRGDYPDKRFEFVDIENLFNDLLSNPQKYNDEYHLNLSILDNSCWHGSYFAAEANMSTNQLLNSTLPRTGDLQAVLKVRSGGQMCTDSERYIFWDRVHPTKQIHAVLYEYLLKELGASFISQ